MMARNYHDLTNDSLQIEAKLGHWHTQALLLKHLEHDSLLGEVSEFLVAQVECPLGWNVARIQVEFVLDSLPLKD